MPLERKTHRVDTADWLQSPESEEVREWLRGSAVVRCQFHRTAADFDVFDTSRGDLGAHFGPLALVNTLPRYAGLEVSGDRIIPAWLRLMNPLRLKDEGSFHSDGIALQLARKGLLSMREARDVHAECDANWRLRKGHDERLRRLIQAAGFDGVSYASVWDAVRGECYIAFDAEQIRPALSCRVDDAMREWQVERPRFC